jgi:hypothetical protein
MQVSVNGADRQRQLEAGARGAFEASADRKLTDGEWTEMRGRLLKFVGILRAWDQTTIRPERGKVEKLCQPEP